MNGTACEEAYRLQLVQKASKKSDPHLGRTFPVALRIVLGRQEQQLELREIQELLEGPRPGTVAVPPRHLLTVKRIKTLMSEDVPGTDKETEMKEILTLGGR